MQMENCYSVEICEKEILYAWVMGMGKSVVNPAVLIMGWSVCEYDQYACYCYAKWKYEAKPMTMRTGLEDLNYVNLWNSCLN